MSGVYLYLLVTSCLLLRVSCVHTQWKGVKGRIITSYCMYGIEKIQTLEDCAIRCASNKGCVGFHYSPKLQECCRGAVDFPYESDATSDAVVYSPFITSAPIRNPPKSSGTSLSECPVVHRDWAPFASKFSWYKYVYNADTDSSPDYLLDGKNTTVARTKNSTYPTMKVDLRGTYRITSVWIISGSQPLQSLEVRFGPSSYIITNGESRITGNTRCGSFAGPTTVPGEVVYITCNNPRGLKGQFLTIQLTERSAVSSPLEIAELRIEGFYRTCDTTRNFI